MPNRHELHPSRSKRKSPDFDPTRRELLKALGLGALGLIASGIANRPEIKLLINLPEFSGEADETRSYLLKWDNEIQKDSNKLKEHLPQIASLAISYFSRQMIEMFPQRQADYDKKRFENAFIFLNTEDFLNKQKISRCNEPPDMRILGFADVADDKVVYVNRNLIFDSNPVSQYFLTMLHELQHLAPPKKSYSPEINFAGIPEPISYERGLIAFARDNSLSIINGRECVVRYRHQIEEAVAEHSALELLSRVGFNIRWSSAYDQFVKDYEQKVIIPLYGGDHKELLDYQQQTKPNDFFRSIGRKVMGGPAEEIVEIAKGDSFIRGVLLGSN